MNQKIRMCFKDRVGIVADISRLIAENGLNIVSMEVVRKLDEAHVYVELEEKGGSADKRKIADVFHDIADALTSDFIDTMPYEERENHFRVVLDNISDGVLSIDREGRITTINRVAAKVWQCGPEIFGKSINNLDMPEYTILDCLEGKRIDNIKKNLITKTGRYQYVSTCKPIRDSSGNIIGAVEIAKDVFEIKKMAQTISDQNNIGFSDIVGQNVSIQEAITFAQKIAPTDACVSIRGDSGTGKELFAKAIHNASDRDGSFVPINCAALPEHLLESELFGYVGGSFTGSKKQGKPGLFEIANKGTVLLDEIGEMPMGAQAKLLRLLQEKAVRRIGGTKEIPIDVRIVTATNKNLENLVQKNLFRQDLYYRINVLPIHIPPLNQRLEDIPLLVEHFLFELARKLGGRKKSFTPEAMDKMVEHDWPGNVRELKNVVKRVAILCDHEMIDTVDILFSHESYRNALCADGDIQIIKQTDRSLKERIGDYEKKIILQTLDRSPSIRKAAANLKISHPALIKKMRKYNITMKVQAIAGEPTR